MLFILLIVCFYDRNSYIYTSGITLIESQNAIAQLLTDVFRWGVGIVGCLVAVLIVERVEQYSIINQILSKLGKESLGIYIVNVYYVKYMLPNLMTMQPIGAVGFAIEIVGSILICYVGALILKKIPFLNSFMLGFRV